MNEVGEARPGCFGCFEVSLGKSNINRFTAYSVNCNILNFNEVTSRTGEFCITLHAAVHTCRKNHGWLRLST